MILLICSNQLIQIQEVSADVASMAIKAAPFIIGTTMALSWAVAVPVIIIGGTIAYKCNDEAVDKAVKDAIYNIKDKMKGPPSPGGIEPPKSEGGKPPLPVIPVNRTLTQISKTVSKTN